MLTRLLALSLILALLPACTFGVYGESTGTDCPSPSMAPDDEGGVRDADEC